MKKIILIFCILTLLVSCADSVDVTACTKEMSQPGFWKGLWHGIISPISFVISLFDDSVSVYSINNSGAWYDFGFLLGASASFTPSTQVRKK